MLMQVRPIRAGTALDSSGYVDGCPGFLVQSLRGRTLECAGRRTRADTHWLLGQRDVAAWVAAAPIHHKG
jgi:hypothetical protein